MNRNSPSNKVQIMLLITMHLLLLQILQLANSATVPNLDAKDGNYLVKPVFETTIPKQHLQPQASDTNKTDQQTENSLQSIRKSLVDEKHRQQADKIVARAPARLRNSNQVQSNMTSITVSKLNKSAYSTKAEKLIKSLSSFMNPGLNPAAYFVPSAAPFPATKTQHHGELGGRRRVTQKIDSIEYNALSEAGPESLAEPSAVVNLRATGEGIVSAQTRMARPQNYVFRWGRR